MKLAPVLKAPTLPWLELTLALEVQATGNSLAP
jgi:hypothetical protein